MSTLTLAMLLNLSFLTTPGQTGQTYEEAYRLATADQNRPLVVLVGADWCPACQSMKQAVLPKVQQDGGLNHVAFAMVNTDRDSKLANQLMSGGSIPQLIMYVKTDKGWTRQQLTGSQSVTSVERFIAAACETPIATTASR